MINAMTIDVEDYFHVSAFADVIRPDDWHKHSFRVSANTHRLLDLFDESGVRATFFVLGWVAKRAPELVHEISRRGHEVACHGMSHELVYRQTPAVFKQETRDSKSLLEDQIGGPVLGYRAASYSIRPDSAWALDLLVEAGFAYDSSIFPIRHDRYGMPDASRVPGRISTPNGESIVEFPLTTAQMWGVRVPVAGGGYFRLLPYWLTRKGLRQVNHEDRQPFVFYLHPWEIDKDQPSIAASRISRFRHYTNIDRCEARLRVLLADFRFGTMIDSLSDLGLLARPPSEGRLSTVPSR